MTRQRAGWAVLLMALAAASCGPIDRSPGTRAAPTPSTPVTTAAPTRVAPGPTVATASPSPAAFVPGPNQAIPRDPAALATALADVTAALDGSIDGWIDVGTTRPPPRALVLQALYEQRIYRLLGREAPLARATVARLGPRLRPLAGANVTAASRLFSLVRPVPASQTFTTGSPAQAGTLLSFYKEAERRFHVDWELLAAVNLVESKFGRVRASSSAGAQGPMQFLPSTWARYGLGGDVHDPHDAILGAANYLHAAGAPGDERAALFAYNHAQAYVDAVLAYAGRMRANWRAYLAYYNWQVFVVTTAGDRRLTGPET